MQGTATKTGEGARARRLLRTPVPIVASAPSAEPPSTPWVLPAVLGVSLGAHGALLILSALLPAPPVGVQQTPAELAFQILEPEPQRIEPAPAPEPEPEVVPEPAPAAIVERPRPAARRVVEPDVEPEVEPEPTEPPPPATTLTASAGGSSDWAHPEGEEGGVPGGVPGAHGVAADGPVGSVAEAPPQPRGISRAELRRRLLGYMRGTLWGFVNGRIDYPLAARRSHIEGVVMLRIRLASDGRLLNVRLDRSSGHHMLDQAALASVQRLAEMPAPPDSIPWDAGQELPLPVTYQLLR